ncbi:MAG: HPr family phosphocarrier protein [Rhodospirillales bacterium]
MCNVTIVNRRGLHARAAAKFVETATRFDAAVEVSRCGQTVSGRSIMGLMMLAAGPGSDIDIAAEGGEGQAALEALRALVENGFDEDLGEDDPGV